MNSLPASQPAFEIPERRLFFGGLGWEQDRKAPMIRMWPRVIKFLGYYPFAEPKDLGEQLLVARRYLGYSQSRLARATAVDEATIRLLERGVRRPSAYTERRLGSLLAGILSVRP